MSSAFRLGMDLQDAQNRRRQRQFEDNEIDKANGVIERLSYRVDKAEPLAQDYLNWLATKKDSPIQFSPEIFAEMRPDQRNPAEMELDQKRAFNLHLVAWAEWWAESLRGSDLVAREKAPKLRGLSDAMRRSEIQASAVAKALEDIADRLELTKGLENPREWVKKRATEMWQTAQWKKNDPTIPVYSSLKPYPPVIQNKMDESGGNFDVVELGVYGINEMMLK